MPETQIEPISAIKDRFPDKIVEFYEKSKKRYYILIEYKDLSAFVDFIFNHLEARYIIVTGLDTPKGIELMYHFAFDKIGIVVTLRTLISREDAEIESISPIITGAQWIEREIHDLLGVTFLHHPDPRRFILSDDWPEGSCPYRKDFVPEKGNNI